jgi:hypothetical protein
VFGESPSGPGVSGFCPLGVGTAGESKSGNGVRAISQDGVAAFASSIQERAGVFLSGTVAPQAGPLVRTSKGGIAQVRLVPSADPKLPTKGSMGDLFMHLQTSAVASPIAVNLYLCVNDQPVQWQQVQLGTTKFAGGQNAP